MKRRNFTQSIIVALGISNSPLSFSLSVKSPELELQTKDDITTKEGLVLNLYQHMNPTKNKDKKQFIITYDVKNKTIPLQEKIYELHLTNGSTHQVYMSPVNNNQLQAVFNWRLNA